MEENEVEEGEAYNYYQEENDESNIDPDVHLSYIDEKIEDCLGHHKEAFERGVSADNLGPKFGGYGSFLPSYQNSPIVLSHPRTPQKIQNYNAPKSPNNLQSEDALENAKVASSVTHVMGLGPDRSTISAEQHPVYRAPAFVGDFTSAHKPVSINPNEKKTLKVRIKVGPGNMPARTNAEIYSGLGLDISPSSSFDDSATESGGLSLESHDAPDESPTSMIRIMTSFPVPGGVLLSPLSDSLLLLMKKEKLMGDNRCGLSYKSSQESSAPCVDESSLRGDRKVYAEKRKLVDKKSVDVNNKNVSDAGKGSSFLKKKIDAVNSVPCNVKVSPISKLKGVTDDLFQNFGRESGGLSIRAVKEEFVSGISKKEMFEPIVGHSVDSPGKQNLKINMPFKCSKGGNATLLKGDLIEPRNFRRRKDGEIQDLSMNKIDASKGRELLDVGGLVDPSTRKTSAAKHGIKVTLARRKSSDGGNLKLNGIVGKDVPAKEFPKRISKVASSSSGKEKTNKTGEFPLTSKTGNNRLHKDSGKPRERGTDLCGDAKVELPENRMDLLETPRYKAIDSVLHVEEKENPNITDKAKERSNVTRKVENLLSSEAYTKLNPIVTPLTGSEPVSDVPAVDQWVGCDKCSKWRLIPYGMDPESFPKTWHCGMLDWLPGMNRCDFSQDDTTTAFYALHQLPPVPVNQNVNNLPHGAVAPGVTLAGQDMNLTHSGDDSHGGFNVGKKKLQKGAPKAYQKDISNSTENSLKASLKSRNLHDVVQSPMESDPSNFPRSNDVKHPRVNRKRGEDQDELKVSKKRKSLDCGNEHWMNDHSQEAAKSGPNSMNVIAKNMIIKDVKCGSKDRTIVSIKNSKGQVAVPVKDGGIAGKKRKVKEWQKSEIYPPESHPSTVPHFSDSSFFVKEETNESEQGKEKKARVSKPEVKELSLSKGGDKTAKRGRGTRILISNSKSTLPLETKESNGGYLDKEQQLGQYVGESTASPRSLDGMEILKKDIGDIQNTVAPSSSSSKVSGSSKTRYDIQEVKGSPVASVSSSPLRNSNPVKIIRERRKPWEKDKFSAGGGSSLRCPGNEPDGGNFETERMEGVIPRSSRVSSGVHHQDRDAIHPLNGESKAQAISSASNADDHNLVNSNCYNSTGSKVKKSKESLQSNDKIRSSKSAHGECDAKVFSPYPEQEQYQKKNLRFQMGMGSQNTSYNEEPRIEKSSFVEKCAVETSKVEKNRSSKKHPIGIPPTEGKIDDRPKFGGNEDSSEVKLNGANSKAGKCRPKQTSLQFHETEEAPSKFASEILTNHLGIATEKEKLLSCSGDKEELLAHLYQPVAGKISISGSDTVVDTRGTLKKSEGPTKLENYSKTHSRQSTTCGYPAKDLNATQIPVKKDPSSQAAANAIKEAKDLKHTADRLMKLGQELESAEIYFQACLKFLHGSSLLERCNTESTKRGDMNYMIEMYSSTAKLWDYVAHAYEKLNVMAAAALAYKCTEVAYMKVIYSKNLIVNKDRHELQEALKMAPPDGATALGESPSSSSSGVDNLNNQVTLDKVALAKADGSQITGSHEIVARNHPKFVRLLNFAENVNNAMEASRKSQNALALAAANAGADVMSSVKSVIDFTFHDIDGLLRLVRLAMETISR